MPLQEGKTASGQKRDAPVVPQDFGGPGWLCADTGFLEKRPVIWAIHPQLVEHQVSPLLQGIPKSPPKAAAISAVDRRVEPTDMGNSRDPSRLGRRRPKAEYGTLRISEDKATESAVAVAVSHRIVVGPRAE